MSGRASRRRPIPVRRPADAARESSSMVASAVLGSPGTPPEPRGIRTIASPSATKSRTPSIAPSWPRSRRDPRGVSPAFWRTPTSSAYSSWPRPLVPVVRARGEASPRAPRGGVRLGGKSPQEGSRGVREEHARRHLRGIPHDAAKSLAIGPRERAGMADVVGLRVGGAGDTHSAERDVEVVRAKTTGGRARRASGRYREGGTEGGRQGCGCGCHPRECVPSASRSCRRAAAGEERR